MSGVWIILKACDGSPTTVARKLTAAGRRCRRQDVEYWAKRGYVPPSWAPLVARTFDVPLWKLNSEVYPRDQIA